MWRTVATTVVSIIVVIFLPVVVMGLILPINDYRAQGMSGVADCDGPLAVMLFIAPSLIVYAGGAAYYALLLKGQSRSVLVFLCVMMVLAAGAKTWAVLREQRSPEHQSTCGES
jgi:hypothetical protein